MDETYDGFTPPKNDVDEEDRGEVKELAGNEVAEVAPPSVVVLVVVV